MDDLKLDAHFADRFEHENKPGCQLYLISPPAIDEGFAAMLAEALDAGPVAAFQLRLKGLARPCDARSRRAAAHALRRARGRLHRQRYHRHSPSGSTPTASTSARMTVTRARRAISPRAGRADRRHLPRQPPPRDGGGRGGGGLRRLRRLLPTTTKAVDHRADPVDPRLVVDDLRAPLRRDWRHHRGQRRPLMEAGADFIAVSERSGVATIRSRRESAASGNAPLRVAAG